MFRDVDFRLSFIAPRRSRHAFTLVELLVVIAIIGILISLLLPAVNAAREAARRSTCQAHLTQIGLAVHLFEDVHRQYPMGRNSRDQMGVSWAFHLLPFLEEQAVHDAYDDSLSVDDDDNAVAMRSPVGIFFCPSRRGPAADRNFDNNDTIPLVLAAAAGGDFAANPGIYFNFAETDNVDRSLAGPIYTFSEVKAKQVTDGLSKTFAVGERHIPPPDSEIDPQLVHYQQGDNAFFAADSPWGIFADTIRGLADGRQDQSRTKFGCEHPSVVQFVFLDRHVEPLSVDTDFDILGWYAAIGDGNDPNQGDGTPGGNET